MEQPRPTSSRRPAADPSRRRTRTRYRRDRPRSHRPRGSSAPTRRRGPRAAPADVDGRSARTQSRLFKRMHEGAETGLCRERSSIIGDPPRRVKGSGRRAGLDDREGPGRRGRAAPRARRVGGGRRPATRSAALPSAIRGWPHPGDRLDIGCEPLGDGPSDGGRVARGKVRSSCAGLGCRSAEGESWRQLHRGVSPSCDSTTGKPKLRPRQSRCYSALDPQAPAGMDLGREWPCRGVEHVNDPFTEVMPSDPRSTRPGGTKAPSAPNQRLRHEQDQGRPSRRRADGTR